MATRAVKKAVRKRGARGTIQTSSHSKLQGQTDERVTENSKEFTEEVSGEPAYVAVTGGLTKNLGDYNSCKVSCTVTLPFAYQGDDSARQAYERASALVDEFLDAEYKKAVGDQ